MGLKDSLSSYPWYPWGCRKSLIQEENELTPMLLSFLRASNEEETGQQLRTIYLS